MKNFTVGEEIVIAEVWPPNTKVGDVKQENYNGPLVPMFDDGPDSGLLYGFVLKVDGDHVYVAPELDDDIEAAIRVQTAITESTKQSDSIAFHLEDMKRTTFFARRISPMTIAQLKQKHQAACLAVQNAKTPAAREKLLKKAYKLRDILYGKRCN